VLIENRHSLKEIGFSISRSKTVDYLWNTWAPGPENGYNFDESDGVLEHAADWHWHDIWHKLCARYVRNAIKLPGASDLIYDKLGIELLVVGDGFGRFDTETYQGGKRNKGVVEMALDLKCLRKLRWNTGREANCIEHCSDWDEDWPPRRRLV